MSPERRPNGDARPYFDDSKGRWYVSIELEAGSDGRRRRKKVSGRTKTEARDKARAVRTKLAEGLPVSDERLTTGQYLEWWRTTVLPGTVDEGTRETYERWLRLYVIPAVGRIPLIKLRPGDVTEMMRAMELRTPPLSAQTRNAARKILGRALRRAMQEELVYRNVASIVDGPKVQRAEGRSLTRVEAKVLVKAFSQERLGMAYLLALALGLRRGEVLGLCWNDLDLDCAEPKVDDWQPNMYVHRQLQRRIGQGLVLLDHLKGKRARHLVLPEQVAGALRSRRARQATDRLGAGEHWQDQLGLVFTTTSGTPVDPDNFGHGLGKITARAGLGSWTTHELRHSAGSLLFAISEILGHSSERVTSEVYVHIQQPHRVEAAEAMTRALWG